MTALVAPKVGSHLLISIKKQSTRQTTPQQTHIAFTMPRFKGIGSCHKSGTGNNQGRQEQPLVITGALIATTVTEREMICHYRWYLFLLYWIIKLSLHLICSQFVNNHPALHIILLGITGALIARTVTQREISCHHRWYMCLIHWIIR